MSKRIVRLGLPLLVTGGVGAIAGALFSPSLGVWTILAIVGGLFVVVVVAGSPIALGPLVHRRHRGRFEESSHSSSTRRERVRMRARTTV